MLEPILYRLREGMLRGFDYRMIGLSDRRASRVLYVPVIDDLLVTPLATLDSSLFERPHYHEQLNALSLTGSYAIEEVTVVLEPLDDLGLDPVVVKIDTEEHELSCLDGMVATIERCKPIFMIERNPQEEQISSVLARLGYERFVYAPDAGELVPWRPGGDSVNLFFLPRDHDLGAS
jgi:hypothetical protein